MDNCFALIDAAKHQIKILRAVKVRAKAIDLFDDRCLCCKEMTDIIIRMKKIWVVIGLKMREVMEFSILIHLVLIAVETVCVTILVNRLHKLK